MDFAKSFDTDYSERCGQYFITLPEAWGEGVIEGVNFEGGGWAYFVTLVNSMKIWKLNLWWTTSIRSSMCFVLKVP